MDSKQIVSILSFLVFFHQSHARNYNSGPSGSPMYSPSYPPSYSPAPGPGYGGCWLLSTRCRNGSLTACIDPSSTGSKEVALFVRNGGERPLTLNVSISHAKAKQINIVKEKEIIPPYHIKEVKIKENLGGNSFIHIDAGTWGCLISIGGGAAAASSGGIFYYLPFATPSSPMNGAYLLLLTGLIIGSACACYKRGKTGDGIRYQQLEMGQPAASPSAGNNVETTQGWEQDWDDQDWQQMANGSSANRLSPRSSTKRDD